MMTMQELKIKFLPQAAAAKSPDQHVLVLVESGVAMEKVFAHRALEATLARKALRELEKPASADVDGRLVVWAPVKSAASTFERHAAIAKALQPLLAESPKRIAMVVHASGAKTAATLAQDAVYVAAVNSHYRLGKPSAAAAVAKNKRGKEKEVTALDEITLCGAADADACRAAVTIAHGNQLARELILRPANDLTPTRYRRDVAALAKARGWTLRELDFAALRKMGAGAFCAVAQGSAHRDAAIVHLQYRPKKAKSSPPIALVGKGICMDTGGHSLKSAKYMYGMHEDMAGSAVALAILEAVAALQLPIAVDAWLAISQNHIGPEAYHPGDVVTALNGTTIEIVNTDAEGRMVLADTLTLAARSRPRAIIDFATLTGAMIYALGNRKSGAFASTAALAAATARASEATGERMALFSAEADYDDALESKIADVKQCLMGGEADAIFATRFLSRFVEATPWVHVDLSSYRNEGGLGAVNADVNGFGVAWGVEMVRTLAT
jgi:leucyl aminopeptidase